MTAIKSLWLVPLIICLAGNAYSTDDENILLFSISKNSSARVGAINSSEKTLRLKIINTAEIEIINQQVPAKSNYFKLFDLSTLPNGIYTVRLLGKGVDEFRRFKVERPRIIVHKEHSPHFKVSGENKDELIISYLNSIQENVQVTFRCNNEIVFEDFNLKDERIVKRYSLRQLPKGNYVVLLKTKINTYTHTFSNL